MVEQMEAPGLVSPMESNGIRTVLVLGRKTGVCLGASDYALFPHIFVKLKKIILGILCIGLR